jgi:CheY-like chemotaxis protein
VLVLDDDKQVTLLLRSILEHNGYDVLVASTANEALESIREYLPDLVITDVFMPDKDGLEFINEVRARHPELKILAISGGSRFTPEPYLAAAKCAGAQRTLAKPFDPADLLQAVNELLAC